MKFTVEKIAAVRALNKPLGVIKSGRTTLPILSNVLVLPGVPGDGLVEFCGTDLATFASAKVEAQFEGPVKGQFNLPAKVLSQILMMAAGTHITFKADVDKGLVEVSDGRSSYRLKGIVGDAFPMMTPVSDVSHFVIGQRDLKDAIRRTIFAASDDESRFILNGICLSAVKDDLNLSLTASDGRRMAVAVIPDAVGPNPFSVVLPTKAAEEVLKCLGDTNNSEVAISLDENQIQVESCDNEDQWRVVANLINGNYPDVSKLVAPTNLKLSAARESLLDAVRRVALATENKAPKMQVVVQNGEIILRVVATDCQAVETVEAAVELAENETVKMVLNPHYLKDCLRALDKDTVTLGFDKQEGTGVVKAPLQILDTTFTYICMPMRDVDSSSSESE